MIEGVWGKRPRCTITGRSAPASACAPARNGLWVSSPTWVARTLNPMTTSACSASAAAVASRSRLRWSSAIWSLWQMKSPVAR